jgi:tRNA nucleotidyltransferase (CCA-adding enzyme)
VIDPFNGFSDLNAGVMRHVSPAFAEDPLRILRLARFLARFTTFTVAEDTLVLCNQLVESGEIAHLVPERVFAELNKGMSEPMPSRMIQLLMQLQAWVTLMAQVPDSTLAQLGSKVLKQIDNLQGGSSPLECSLSEARWIYLVGGFEASTRIDSLGQTLRMPSQLTDEARVAAQIQTFLSLLQSSLSELEGQFVLDAPSPFVSKVAPWFIDLFGRVDIYRKPDRLLRVLSVLDQIPLDFQSAHQLDRAHWALSCLRKGAQAQLSEAYKTGLRQFMVSHAGVNPADLVAQFRSDWVAQLLQA